ncbi:Uncharacterised protein [Bordetella pertussis]|nr:Uncharacterised protein [Bordetella pertussis]
MAEIPASSIAAMMRSRSASSGVMINVLNCFITNPCQSAGSRPAFRRSKGKARACTHLRQCGAVLRNRASQHLSTLQCLTLMLIGDDVTRAPGYHAFG